jgi:uncharacterized membrane protein YhaH (DUF805 family)
MNWYLEVLRKYAVFSGRARRSEYWYFVLFNFIISVILSFIDYGFGWVNTQNGVGVLTTIYSLLVLIPTLAVMVRRLHDTDKSGWWILLGLIPLVGPIVLIVFFCINSTMGDNTYGPSPKVEVVNG